MPAPVAAIHAAGGRPAGAEAPRLRGAEDQAGDGATGDGGDDPVDRPGDEIRDEAAGREAEERREPAQRAPAGVHDATAPASGPRTGVGARGGRRMTAAKAISQTTRGCIRGSSRCR